jgi:hypothetical protein
MSLPYISTMLVRVLGVAHSSGALLAHGDFCASNSFWLARTLRPAK